MTEPTPKPKKTMINKGLPPFIRTWKRFYWLIISWLVVLILLFYWFTEHYS